MELKDADPEQIREVYARFGLAMYQAQCVERQIAILLANVSILILRSLADRPRSGL